MSDTVRTRRPHLWLWLCVGSALSALAAALTWFSHLFSYDYTLNELPALPLTAGLVVAGLLYLTIPFLIRSSLDLPANKRRQLLFVIIFFGIGMRALLLWSEPALEDDYQRYMWDGAVSAHGLNPYEISPAAAAKQSPDTSDGALYRKLVKQSAPVHERINHAYLKTIYPPVTQSAFALAHFMKPWSIVSWRLVCLAGEFAALGLLILLLREAGRSQLWVALYWWNPIVVKELINSAHMEAIVTPFILAALLFAIRRHFVFATTSLGLAMGAKIWPALLAPLIWRQALSRPKLLVFCALLLALMAGLWAYPIWMGGIDKSSGFVAYAQRWKTGSALTPQLEAIANWVLSTLELPLNWRAISTRAFLAGCLGLIILWVSWPPIGEQRNPALDLMRRAGLAIAVLFLLSPSQFPWYFIWVVPFLCFMPSLGLLAITALIPLYYTAFYFIAIDHKEVFRHSVVWVIWLPVWGILLGEVWWNATAWRRWAPDCHGPNNSPHATFGDGGRG